MIERILQKESVIIIGSGLAGMSAALTFAEKGQKSILVSSIAAERAQSVMAEGGINAAMDTKNEQDDPMQHAADTLKSAAGIVSESAVRGLAMAAPKIVAQLHKAGVQFNTDGAGNVDLRNFGGQKKKRTAFARDDTGKQIVTALVDAVRKHEDDGLVSRKSHHLFCTLIFNESKTRVCGCRIKDIFTGKEEDIVSQSVVIASGGLHGLLKETTGSLNDTGAVTNELFRLGVPLANLEMIQYHPTTVPANGKLMLITEAARGEGGRLFAMRDGEKWYFMEEKYPELKNLMPRDVTARENWRVKNENGLDVYLDLTELTEDILDEKLSGLVSDCITYTGTDPHSAAIPVAPGIHYFMGGILVDDDHHTAVRGLYAAGECAAQYHGANRLGGNSLLGAIHGGHIAACTAIDELDAEDMIEDGHISIDDDYVMYDDEKDIDSLQEILQSALGVVRNEETMTSALKKASAQSGSAKNVGCAMLMSAIARKESRGGHFRSDYPERDASFEKVSIASLDGDNVSIEFLDADKITEMISKAQHKQIDKQ